MKVMLISPSITSYKKNLKRIIAPLSLGYLGAVLRKEFDVQILDSALEGYNNEVAVDEELMVYGLNDDELVGRIKRFNPDLIGVALPFSSQADNSLKICRLVKGLSSNIKVIVGGVHASVMFEDILNSGNVDYVAIGEGEQTLLELCKSIRDNKSVLEIKGLAYKVDGKIHVNTKREFIANLDELPFPARDLMNMEKYLSINTPHGPYAKRKVGSILTSRGCRGVCTYCSSHVVAGYKFRARSAKNVLEEVKELIEKYNIGEIQIEDDNFIHDKERAIEFLQGLKKFNIVWCTPNGVRIDDADFELLKLMKESGCYQLTFGIESGSEYVLHKLMKKKIDLKKVKPIVKEAKRLGIGIHLFFIVGMPTETKLQMKETFKYAKYINPDSASFAIANPLPGSQLYKNCIEKNYLRKGFSFRDTLYRKANIKLNDFNFKEFEDWIDVQNKNFNISLIYRNPKNFMKKYISFMVKKPKLILKSFRKNT